MAWIETRGKAKNKVWRVRWYDAAGKQRSQTFHDYPTAKAFEVEVESRQQRGQVAAVDAGRITLDEFVVETWIPTYAATKALNTQLDYEARYKHVAPLGAYTLRDLTPEVIRRWQAQLETRRVTPHMRHKALGLLGNILQRAVEGEHIPTNPARLVTPPKLPRSKEVVPFSPAEIEAIRTVALAPAPIEVPASEPGKRSRRAYSAPAPGTAYRRQRDATLISVMAYAGLRPHEAWILTWGDVRERTLLVYSPKTDSTRTVRLLAPLADDLRRFRMASGRPNEAALIFPGPDGREWDKTTYDNRQWTRYFLPIGGRVFVLGLPNDAPTQAAWYRPAPPLVPAALWEAGARRVLRLIARDIQRTTGWVDDADRVETLAAQLNLRYRRPNVRRAVKKAPRRWEQQLARDTDATWLR